MKTGMKLALVLALAGAGVAQSSMMYMAPSAGPVNADGAGQHFYIPEPNDPSAYPYFFYMWGASAYVMWDTLSNQPGPAQYLVPGELYEVAMSWAVAADKNPQAAFHFRIDGTGSPSYWDYSMIIDQTKDAAGIAGVGDNTWSGWYTVGTYTAATDYALFAWNTEGADNTGLVVTTGSVRLTLIPEPGSISLMFGAMGVLAVLRRRLYG